LFGHNNHQHHHRIIEKKRPNSKMAFYESSSAVQEEWLQIFQSQRLVLVHCYDDSVMNAATEALLLSNKEQSKLAVTGIYLRFPHSRKAIGVSSSSFQRMLYAIQKTSYSIEWLDFSFCGNGTSQLIASTLAENGPIQAENLSEVSFGLASVLKVWKQRISRKTEL